MEKGAYDVAANNGAHQTHGAGNFITLVLLIIVLSYAAGVRADDLHVLVNGKAIHFDKQPNVNYNENNWGAGFQYDWGSKNDPWVPFVTASGFNDSNRNPSYYAGGGYLRRYYLSDSKTAWHADLGFVGFLMKRKDFKDGDLFPGVLPAFSIGSDKVALNLTYIPRVDPKMVPILFLQLKITLAGF